jgi:ferredoxin-NADP reductase
MAAIEGIVQRLFVPLAENTWQSRRPVGHVDRELHCVVAKIEDVADGCRAFTLVRADGTPLPSWFPGAHIDVVLPSGKLRQYSLNGMRNDKRSWRIAVRRIPIEAGGGGGSIEMHELAVGDRLTVKGPRDAFPFVFNPQGYLFVAGGIGITPILPMLRAVEAAGADWRLLYGGRSRATMPFLDEIEQLGGRVTVVPEDESGLPDLASFLANSPLGAAVYCCGPDPLMDAVTAALGPGRTPHLERFAPGAASAGAAFEVELRRSGRTLAVPADRSLLATVREELPGVSYSCEQGFCGTCQQRVLEGEIDHRDELLTDAERDGSMLICVSRCLGKKLVLDL